MTHQTDTRCPVLEIELCTTLGARLSAILADLNRESYYHQRRALARPTLDGACRDLSRLIHQLEQRAADAIARRDRVIVAVLAQEQPR